MTTCAFCNHPAFEHDHSYENGEARWACSSRDAGRVCNCRRFRPMEVQAYR